MGAIVFLIFFKRKIVNFKVTQFFKNSNIFDITL